MEEAMDRTGWPSGPWDNEPDRVEWKMAEPPGYPLLIVRGPMGSLCGYVGLPPGHPLHGVGWDAPEVEALDAHGGINYAKACSGNICHVPAPGEPDDVWWLGFDCSHAWDYSPGLQARVASRSGGKATYVGSPPEYLDETYRTVEYVKTAVEELAATLARSAASPTR